MSDYHPLREYSVVYFRGAGSRNGPLLGSCQNRRFSRDCERLCTTSEALIYAAMGRLMLRRLARTDFSDSF